MESKTSIIWTTNSKNTLKEVLEFVVNNWSLKIAIKVDLEIQNYLLLLANNHKMCSKFGIEDLRKCVISKHTSLIYRIIGEEVELIAFIPNKSNHNY